MGRPTLLTEELKESIVRSAEVIFHYKWVAKSVGIDEDTLLKYRTQDKDLSDRLEQARSRFIESNLKKARPDFKLETADRETFGRKEEVTVTIDPTKKILEKYGLLEGDDVTEADKT